MTVLLIDDQPSILSALTSGIDWNILGFTSVLTATSAARARKILSEHSVDLVLSDIEMPNEDGLSLLSWARKEGYDFECILLTAHADFFYAKRAITLNVFDYVVQPARFEDIIASVKKALEAIRLKRLHQTSDSHQQLSAAAGNIVLSSLLEGWPDYETSLLYPQELEKRLQQLQHFGLPCSETTPCFLFSLFVPPSREDPSGSFALLCRLYYKQLTRELDVTGFSCFLAESRFFALLFMPLPESPLPLLSVPLNEASVKAGCSAGLVCTAAQLRFLKDAMNLLLQQERGASAASQPVFCPFRQDDILGSVVGQNRYLQYIGQIRSYILNHMAEPISRQDIADSLHLSPDHVSFVVKTTENMTIKELINSVKMEHARRLLRSTKMPIGEISQKCGFDSFAYFSKVYRETYHLTPSQERGKDGKEKGNVPSE